MSKCHVKVLTEAKCHVKVLGGAFFVERVFGSRRKLVERAFDPFPDLPKSIV